MTDPSQPSQKQPATSLLNSPGRPNSGPRILLATSLLATVVWLVAIYYLAPQVGEGGCPTSDFTVYREWSWLAILAILTLFLIGVGHHVTGHWRALVIDDRYKISLSKLQLVLWTMLVLSAFANALVWTVIQVEYTRGDPLNLSIPQELLWLMGISAGVLIGAHVIKTDQLDKGKLHTNSHYAEADWTDILKSEWNGHEQELDLGKIQMLLFTVILVGGYAAVLFMTFADCGDFAFPVLSNTAVGLLGISQIGYLTAKATQKHARKNRKSERSADGTDATKVNNQDRADTEK